MEEVIIITRDINGTRNSHYLRWDNVCDYIQKSKFTEDDEILLVIVEGTCIYSGLWTVNQLTWTELQSFFA